jgi:serine/threonine protein kinase
MDLRRLVKSRGPLPIQQAAGIVMQAALGLDYAHQKGMIHRDVKPGNILVTPDGVAKVSDVGLAGFAVDLLDDPRAGKIIGTADYLSPEQIRTPLEVSTVSDIYSLGCTLYYAICGKVPFPGGDTTSKIRRHLSETPWHPRKFQPDLTEEFVDIIADMMEKNPRERTQTCSEVAVRLEPWAGDAGELTTLRMTRSPWMAPPPSMETPAELPDEGVVESTGFSMETNPVLPRARDPQANSISGVIPPVQSELPKQPVGTESGMDRYLSGKLPNSIPAHSTSSTWMIVAITVALVLPPALVVGAILGIVLKESITINR